MAHIQITLSSALLLSDDGGAYENETGPNQRQAEIKSRTRLLHYQRNGDTVSFDYQTSGGETKVNIIGDHTVY